MIETKEQYEEAKSKSNSTVADCVETIEALRELARAGNQLMSELDIAWNEGRLPHDATSGETVRRYNKARDALPDWISEDG